MATFGKILKIICCGLLLCTMIHQTAISQCVSSVNSFYAGEKLSYHALYTWGFVWIHAGNVQFSVTSQKIGPIPGYTFTAKASSVKAFDWFFKVRDSFQSLVMADKLTPIWFDQNTSEGGFEVRQNYSFDQLGSRIFHRASITRRPNIQDTVKIPPCTFDILSTIYYCRTITFSQYKIKDRLTINTLIDGKLYPIHIQFLGKEIIPALHGKERFSCFKIEVTAVESTNFKEGQKINVWFTDDDNRIPVLIEAKVVVGSVKGYLDLYEGLRNPLKSRIVSK